MLFIYEISPGEQSIKLRKVGAVQSEDPVESSQSRVQRAEMHFQREISRSFK